LYRRLRPFEEITIGDSKVKLFIPDRTCVYWAKNGPDSEPTTSAWIKSFASEDTFVDIGANIGLYSLMAAAQGVSKVYAFEPNPFSFSVLVHNIVTNGFGSRIVPFCLAMNEKSSIVTFKLNGTQAGSVGNEIAVESVHPESTSIETVSFSIDELFHTQGISGVNHLKIDVDGMEMEILRGATGLLSDNSLKSVLVEDFSKDEQEKLKLPSFMKQFDFHLSQDWGNDPQCNKIFVRN
jgi:FkbM family methyltransferase